eukprot:scaffold2804_cov181-Amphora_coffeaeformis.AAC.21
MSRTIIHIVSVLLLLLIASRPGYAFQTSPKSRIRTISPLNDAEHSLTPDDDELYLEPDGPKARLLDAIGYDITTSSTDVLPRFAFALRPDASSSNSDEISECANDLSGYVLPLDKSSKWTLIYTDAPDLLGFQGGPMSQLVSIRNDVISSKDMEIVLTYKPSNNMVQWTSSFLSDINDDRLEQAVLFAYQVGAMNRVDVELKGTRIEGSRLGSLPAIQSPAGLPWGGFSIIFNDGDLRIDKSTQGDFLFIYKRSDQARGN